MDVYMFEAALLCHTCGVATMARLSSEGKAPEDPEDETTFDSDDYPKGPFGDGGGEADSPQHCDSCQAFLENPLTDEGMKYVRETVQEDLKAGRTDSVAVTTWAPFYEISTEPEEEEVPE